MSKYLRIYFIIFFLVLVSLPAYAKVNKKLVDELSNAVIKGDGPNVRKVLQKIKDDGIDINSLPLDYDVYFVQAFKDAIYYKHEDVVAILLNSSRSLKNKSSTILKMLQKRKKNTSQQEYERNMKAAMKEASKSYLKMMKTLMSQNTKQPNIANSYSDAKAKNKNFKMAMEKISKSYQKNLVNVLVKLNTSLNEKKSKTSKEQENTKNKINKKITNYLNLMSNLLNHTKSPKNKTVVSKTNATIKKLNVLKTGLEKTHEKSIKQNNGKSNSASIKQANNPGLSIPQESKANPVKLKKLDSRLLMAISKNDVPLLKKLLGEGADVNAKYNKGTGMTALILAVYLGNTEAVYALLDNGADVNAKCINGITALMAEAGSPKKDPKDNGRRNILEALIFKGADINAKNDDGFTAFDIAKKSAGIGEAMVFQYIINNPTHSWKKSRSKTISYDILASERNIRIGKKKRYKAKIRVEGRLKAEERRKANIRQKKRLSLTHISIQKKYEEKAKKIVISSTNYITDISKYQKKIKALLSENPKEAIPYALAIVIMNQGKYSCLEQLAFTLDVAGYFKEAKQQYELLVEKTKTAFDNNPKNYFPGYSTLADIIYPTYLLKLANFLHQSKNFTEAEKNYLRVIDIFDIKSIKNRGGTYPLFRKNMKKYKAGTYRLLGQLYDSMGKGTKADQAFISSKRRESMTREEFDRSNKIKANRLLEKTLRFSHYDLANYYHLKGMEKDEIFHYVKAMERGSSGEVNLLAERINRIKSSGNLSKLAVYKKILDEEYKKTLHGKIVKRNGAKENFEGFYALTGISRKDTRSKAEKALYAALEKKIYCWSEGYSCINDELFNVLIQFPELEHKEEKIKLAFNNYLLTSHKYVAAKIAKGYFLKMSSLPQIELLLQDMLYLKSVYSHIQLVKMCDGSSAISSNMRYFYRSGNKDINKLLRVFKTASSINIIYTYEDNPSLRKLVVEYFKGTMFRYGTISRDKVKNPAFWNNFDYTRKSILRKIGEAYGKVTKEIEEIASEYNTWQTREPTIDAIIDELPINTIYIDYLIYASKTYNEKRYFAFIIKKKEKGYSVGYSDIGSFDKINNLIKKTREKIAGKETIKDLSIKLSNILIKPFLKELNVPNQEYSLILSPTESLYLLPFEILQIPESTYSLVDKFTPTYGDARSILAERILSEFNTDKQEAKANPGVIFANPDYGLGRVNKVVVVAKAPVMKLPLPGGERNTGNEQCISFEKLKETGTEGIAIKEKAGDKAILLSGKDATEDAVFALRSPKFIHFATHGFFLKKKYSGDTSDEEYLKIQRTRAGLALAGANDLVTQYKNKQCGGDGILTALEISELNLLGTDLVVASACDTGNDIVWGGKVVSGIRSAFRYAGAKNVIVSLWSVKDLPAKEFMDKFYEKYFEGISPKEALRSARKYVQKKNPRPYYWAGFILEGSLH